LRTGSRTQVRLCTNYETMSHAAAEFFVSKYQNSAALSGRFIVALSGGVTPRRFFSLLASSPYVEAIQWSLTHFFWADERCVPKDHIENNFKFAKDAFLSKVAVPRENIHRINGENGPERAARDYEQTIRSFFGTPAMPVFDLIILGAGEDGHTASLFTGTAALHERTRLAMPVSSGSVHLGRVTLTLQVLNHAEQILFLVSGRSKAKVLHEILEDGNPKEFPAGLVQPVHGTVTWLFDREASSLLINRTYMNDRYETIFSP